MEKSPNLRRLRLILAFVILLVSISMLMWGIWPLKRETLIRPIQPAEIQLPTPISNTIGDGSERAAAATQMPAEIFFMTGKPDFSKAALTATPFSVNPTLASTEPPAGEFRKLELEFPPKIRIGDPDIIRLSLDMDEAVDPTPSAYNSGSVGAGQGRILPGLYSTHAVIAEALLDLPGMEVQPKQTVSEPLLSGQSATFHWSIQANAPGVKRGTAWLHIRFIDKISGEESRMTVSGQIIEIESVNLLGLSGRAVRVIGTIGILLAVVLGFPFLEDYFKSILLNKEE